MSEEDEDEQLVESSAPVTKQPRTATVEGDAGDHGVGRAMAPPSTSDSTDTDVPMGQATTAPSKLASIGGSTPVRAATKPSMINSINDGTPMVRRLDGTCEALPSKIDNPNFAPRKAHPGGKMATNDKDEVHVKYHLRKKVPIEEWPEHLRRKKAEMDAADGDDGRLATGDELGGGDKSDGNGVTKAAGDRPKKKKKRRPKDEVRRRKPQGERQRNDRRGETAAAAADGG